MTTNLNILLNQYCPNGVPWVKLGSLGSFENIGVDKKSLPDEEEVVLLNYTDIYHNRYITSDIPKMVVTANDKKREQCTVEKGDIFVTPSSETIDDIGHAALILETIPNAVYSYHIMRYRLNEINMTTGRYINYLFETSIIQEQIAKVAQGLTRFGVSKYKFADMQIPLPPLPVQEEIVRILDSMTALIDNIDEEIRRRMIEFNFCRKNLLTFKKDIICLPLNEVASHYTGLTYKPENVCEHGTLVLRSSNIQNSQLSFNDNVYVKMDNIPSRALVKTDDILVCVRNGSRALIGKSAMITKEAIGAAFGAFMTVLRTEKINSKFLFYIWQSSIVQDQIKGDDGAPINQITNKEFSRISIPVPPLHVQQQIVDQLDTFESLINNLKTERNLRQKQYEYYREKLLTFK